MGESLVILFSQRKVVKSQFHPQGMKYWQFRLLKRHLDSILRAWKSQFHPQGMKYWQFRLLNVIGLHPQGMESEHHHHYLWHISDISKCQASLSHLVQWDKKASKTKFLYLIICTKVNLTWEMPNITQTYLTLNQDLVNQLPWNWVSMKQVRHP